MKIQKREVCGDLVLEAVHESGLKIAVCPKKGYSSSYAIFGTAYGSVDTTFRREGEEAVEVPAGIAHFLEHKLFESEEGDAFSLFAKTGASANAFTSFDKTCYLFSCADSFLPSLEILLNFVQKPYFTKETVQKEQGIIGQEIRMGEDNPGRRVLWNLLRAMYQKHPVRIEIAGTVESIAEIDDALLYRCYETFYQPGNMALCVVGNVEPDAVFDAVERLLKKRDCAPVERMTPQEPDEIAQAVVEEEFAVSVPLFYLGFKESCTETRKSAKEMAEIEIMLEMLASSASPLYRKLEAAGLINSSFGYDFFEGPGYAAVLFGGESAEPEKAKEMIWAEIEQIQQNGMDAELFECARRAVYGQKVAAMGNVGTVAREMADAAFAGRVYGEVLDWVAKVSAEDVAERMKQVLRADRMAISVLRPIQKEN